MYSIDLWYCSKLFQKKTPHCSGKLLLYNLNKNYAISDPQEISCETLKVLQIEILMLTFLVNQK